MFSLLDIPLPPLTLSCECWVGLHLWIWTVQSKKPALSEQSARVNSASIKSSSFRTYRTTGGYDPIHIL